MHLTDLLDAIDSERQDEELSSAIRLVVLNFYRHQLLCGRSSPALGRTSAEPRSVSFSAPQGKGRRNYLGWRQERNVTELEFTQLPR